MNSNQTAVKRMTATFLLVFPSILLLSFVMHMHSPGAFFNFRMRPTLYNSEALFNSLIQSRGGSFIHSHIMAYISVPFLILTILSLGYLLYPRKPLISFLGVAIGITGSVCMAGFLASWLSFSAIGGVEPENYKGAQATLFQLTRMNGVLRIITNLSLLSFVGIIVLSVGLLNTNLISKWSLLSIIAGCLLIGFFWSLVNWMLIGAVFLLIGLIAVTRQLNKEMLIN